MARAWSPEELAWAHECAAAGDTFEEIGGALECSAGVVRSRLGVKRRLPETHRAVAELEAAGIPRAEIASQLLPGRRSGRHAVYTYLQTMREWGYRIPVRQPQGARKTAEQRDERARIAERCSAARERNLAMAAVLGTGPSYSEIALRFGASRSAVAGVARRIRLSQQGEAAHV